MKNKVWIVQKRMKNSFDNWVIVYVTNTFGKVQEYIRVANINFDNKFEFRYEVWSII